MSQVRSTASPALRVPRGQATELHLSLLTRPWNGSRMAAKAIGERSHYQPKPAMVPTFRRRGEIGRSGPERGAKQTVQRSPKLLRPLGSSALELPSKADIGRCTKASAPRSWRTEKLGP